MECNKDEALRAKRIAEKKLMENDFAGAKRFALMAERLYPKLEGLHPFLTVVFVYVNNEMKITGDQSDYYRILGVDPLANEQALKNQYKRMALALHPDKNKSVGANGAFQIVSKAWNVLSDKDTRTEYDRLYVNVPKPETRRTHDSTPVSATTTTTASTSAAAAEVRPKSSVPSTSAAAAEVRPKSSVPSAAAAEVRPKSSVPSTSAAEVCPRSSVPSTSAVAAEVRPKSSVPSTSAAAAEVRPKSSVPSAAAAEVRPKSSVPSTSAAAAKVRPKSSVPSTYAAAAEVHPKSSVPSTASHGDTRARTAIATSKFVASILRKHGKGRGDKECRCPNANGFSFWFFKKRCSKCHK